MTRKGRSRKTKKGIRKKIMEIFGKQRKKEDRKKERKRKK